MLPLPPARILTLATLLGVTLAATSPVRAAAPPSFAERVDVRLVNLEVFVTDAAGRAVEDLKPEDFRVFDDGRPVTLQSFAWIEGSKGGGGGAARPGADERGAGEAPVRVVVVLDEEHTRAPDRTALFRKLGETLGGRLPRGSQVTIWRYDGAMKVLLPFTGDRRELLAALDRAAATISSTQVNLDEDRLATLNALHDDAVNGPCLYGEGIARAYSEEKRDEVERTLRALDRLVATLEGLPGRKLVLYVSDGIPMRPGEEAWDTFLELCGGGLAASGRKEAKDVSAMSLDEQAMRPAPAALRLESLTFDTSKQWDSLAARASGQGVSLYTLVTAGPAAFDTSIQLDDVVGPSALVLAGAEKNRLDAMYFLAAETGGRVMYNGAGLDKALAGITEDLGFYLLGYPAPAPGDRRIRRLRVEVARPGARVRHRRSYALASDDQRASDKLLTRLYHGVGDNPLGLTLAAGPPGPKDPPGSARLQLTVPLRGLTLLPEAAAAPPLLHGMISVFVVARDAAGSVTPVRRRLLPLQLSTTDVEAGRQRTFRYEVEMPLGRGRNDVAVAVRDEVTGELSFAGESVSLQR